MFLLKCWIGSTFLSFVDFRLAVIKWLTNFNSVWPRVAFGVGWVVWLTHVALAGCQLSVLADSTVWVFLSLFLHFARIITSIHSRVSPAVICRILWLLSTIRILGIWNLGRHWILVWHVLWLHSGTSSYINIVRYCLYELTILLGRADEVCILCKLVGIVGLIVHANLLSCLVLTKAQVTTLIKCVLCKCIVLVALS